LTTSSSRGSSSDFLLRASAILKTLGHPVRLEIVKYLRYEEHSVAEIQKHLNLIQSVTSQHLRLLDRKGIVKWRPEGTTRYYSIANIFIHRILECFTECETLIQSGDWETGRPNHQDKEERRLVP